MFIKQNTYWKLKSQISRYHKGIFQRFMDITICGLDTAPTTMSTPYSPRNSAACCLGSTAWKKAMQTKFVNLNCSHAREYDRVACRSLYLVPNFWQRQNNDWNGWCSLHSRNNSNSFTGQELEGKRATLTTDPWRNWSFLRLSRKTDMWVAQNFKSQARKSCSSDQRRKAQKPSATSDTICNFSREAQGWPWERISALTWWDSKGCFFLDGPARRRLKPSKVWEMSGSSTGLGRPSFLCSHAMP